MRNILETASIFSLAITVPVLGIFSAWHEAREDRNLDYLTVALSILSEDENVSTSEAGSEPEANSVTREHLREWAIDVVRDMSPVNVPDEVLDGLKSGGRLPKSVAWSDLGYDNGKHSYSTDFGGYDPEVPSRPPRTPPNPQ